MSNDDAKLKALALEIGAQAFLANDLGALMTAVRSAITNGMPKDQVSELVRQIMNAASRLAFGAGLALAASHLMESEGEELADHPGNGPVLH